MHLPRDTFELHRRIGLGDGDGGGVLIKSIQELLDCQMYLSRFVVAAGEAAVPGLLDGNWTTEEALAISLAESRRRWHGFDTLVAALNDMERHFLLTAKAKA